MSPSRIVWHKRVLRIRAKRRWLRKRKTKQENHRNGEFFKITAPHEFNLSEPNKRAKLLKFLEKIKQAHIQKQNIFLDFSPTERMFAAGTLLFKAELCRLARRLTCGQTYKCKLPHHEPVRQVLQQTGILPLLNHQDSVPTSLPGVVHWCSANGSKVEGAKYDLVMNHYEGTITEKLLKGFYIGLTEAMTNTVNHAYIEPRNDTLNVKKAEEGWWMFSQNKDGKLHLLICDLGIGIPRSLPKQRPGIAKRLLTLGKGVRNDYEYIKAAIEDSYSRTEQSYRGKGLGQIVRIVKDNPRSSLIIYSNKGCYSALEGNKPEFKDYDDSIFGTIVSWSIPLQETV